MRQSYNVVYIGNKFLNSYNAIQGITNSGAVSKSVTVDEFIIKVKGLIQNRYIDIYMIEQDAIIPSVNGTFIDAVEYIKLNAPFARIIVIAPGYNDPRGLNRLVSFGVYDIVTHIQYSDDPIVSFTTNKDILESAIVNEVPLSEVKKYLDYNMEFFNYSDIKKISKGKITKKRKNATSIAILASHDNKFKDQLTGIFNQNKNYYVEYSDVLRHQHFGDIPPSVQYLIIQDPNKEQMEQLTPPPNSNHNFFPIALFTSYAKYKSNRSDDSFAILYSDYTSETFIESLEGQIKKYQSVAALGDTTSMRLDSFIPEGYVKKLPKWKLLLIILGVFVLIAGVAYGIKVSYDMVIENLGQNLIDTQKKLDSEKMTLSFASNPHIVNPFDEIDLTSLVDEYEDGATLSHKEFSPSMTEKEGEFEIEYTITKGDLSKSAKIKIIVKDSKSPDIKLNTDSITINEGDSVDGKKYLVSAIDKYDGDITDKVEISYQKNKSIIYKVKDAAGNVSEKTISVSVKTKEPTTPKPPNQGTSPTPTPKPVPPKDNGGGGSKPPSGAIMITGPDVIYVDRTDNAATATQQLNANLRQYGVINAPKGGKVSADWGSVAYHRTGQYVVTIKFSGADGSASKDVVVTVR